MDIGGMCEVFIIKYLNFTILLKLSPYFLA